MKYGRLVNDLIRYTQILRASGTARCDGHELTLDRWHAMRDHSWGIRSTMGPPSPIKGVDRIESERDDRALRLWVPFEVGDHWGFFHTHDDRSGATLDLEGRLDFADGSSLDVVAAKHALAYEPGTKRLAGGSFSLQTKDGRWRDYQITPAAPPADVQGLGYYRGWKDGGSAGVYRGPETVEHDRYRSEAGPEPGGPPHVPVERRLGPTEYPCFITADDGGEGMGLVEHYIYGAYEPYSFT